MCRECKSAYELERKQRSNTRDPAIDVLLETITEMAKRLELLEKAAKKHGWSLGDDTDEEKDTRPKASKVKPKKEESSDDESPDERPKVTRKATRPRKKMVSDDEVPKKVVGKAKVTKTHK